MKSKIINFIFSILPGANRVVIFFIAANLLTVNEFASFSAIYSIAVVVSMVGGVGIGTLVIKDELQLNVIGFFKLIFLSICVSLPVLVLCILYGQISDSISFIALSIALSANQIYRNEILFKKKFSFGVLYESSILISIIFSFFHFKYNALNEISTIYLIISILFKIIENNKRTYFNICIKQVSYISYSNLISSGILFMLPSMCLVLTTAEVTKSVSLLVSIIGVVSVFPRAIFNYGIKDVKNFLMDRDSIRYKEYIRKFRFYTSGIMFFSFILVNLYMYYINNSQRNELSFSMIFILISLVSVFIFIGQLFIPETTLVNMIGFEKYSLLLNALNFILFVTTYYVLDLIKISNQFIPIYILCISIILGYLIRSLAINIKIKEYIKNESSIL
ncbi:hypothetical protein ACPVC1_002111 [Vibrio cholerae]